MVNGLLIGDHPVSVIKRGHVRYIYYHKYTKKKKTRDLRVFCIIKRPVCLE